MKKKVALVCLFFLALSVFLIHSFKVRNKNTCDILIVGGGLGGSAAAQTISELHKDYGVQKICLTEQTDWLGGQMSSQGVPHDLKDDTYLFTPSYIKLLDCVGNALPSIGSVGHLPIKGHECVINTIQPSMDSGLLKIYFNTIPIEAQKNKKNEVTSIRFDQQGKLFTLYAKRIIDATELGDLLPLTKTEYVKGRESYEESGEAILQSYKYRDTIYYPKKNETLSQYFTYTAALQRMPKGEDHRPCKTKQACMDAGWRTSDDHYPFKQIDLSIEDAVKKTDLFYPHIWANDTYPQKSDAKYVIWNSQSWCIEPFFFIPSDSLRRCEKRANSFWNYRRVLNAQNLGQYQEGVGDIMMLNFPLNDWKGFSTWDNGKNISIEYETANIIDVSPEQKEERLEGAKMLTKNVIYYLQNDILRLPEDGLNPITGTPYGYPNIRIATEVTGTPDGISKHPYIRESRRIVSLRNITYEYADDNISLKHDAIGISRYRLDFHNNALQDFNQSIDMGKQTITLSSLIPKETENLIAGAKNIGMSHLINAAYRTHTFEWKIGVAAGILALHSFRDNLPVQEYIESNILKNTLSEKEKRMREIQKTLLENGNTFFISNNDTWSIEKSIEYVSKRLALPMN